MEHDVNINNTNIIDKISIEINNLIMVRIMVIEEFEIKNHVFIYIVCNIIWLLKCVLKILFVDT